MIIRGNNREQIFYADEDDRFYPKKLQAACEKHNCDVHAYVFMTNHVHLLITPHKKTAFLKPCR
ncbi:MAG: transposase [Candidatus Electrothrix communis]|nr:MAG: transposase [Candidatus Electrothrix communis]